MRYSLQASLAVDGRLNLVEIFEIFAMRIRANRSCRNYQTSSLPKDPNHAETLTLPNLRGNNSRSSKPKPTPLRDGQPTRR